jgi:hypothetical protein
MPNPSIKDEKLYQDLRKQGDSKEKAAHFQRCSGARPIQRRQVRRRLGLLRRLDPSTTQETRQRAWDVRLLEPDQRQADQQTTKPLSDQRAKIGPAIGAPMVSVTNIRIIKNHPAPCQPHQTPRSRQTR